MAALDPDGCPRSGTLPSIRNAALDPGRCPRSGTLPLIWNAALDLERCPRSGMLPSIRSLTPGLPVTLDEHDGVPDARPARHVGRARRRPCCPTCLSCWRNTSASLSFAGSSPEVWYLAFDTTGSFLAHQDTKILW